MLSLEFWQQSLLEMIEEKKSGRKHSKMENEKKIKNQLRLDLHSLLDWTVRKSKKKYDTQLMMIINAASYFIITLVITFIRNQKSKQKRQKKRCNYIRGSKKAIWINWKNIFQTRLSYRSDRNGRHQRIYFIFALQTGFMARYAKINQKAKIYCRSVETEYCLSHHLL